MASRFIRNGVGLAASFLAVALMLVVNAWLVLANYMACSYSFFLQGVDAKPLGKEELLGQWLGAIAPQATLSHFYALVLAAVIAAGFFWAFHLLIEIVRAVQQRRLATMSEDREQMNAWAWILIEHCFYLVLVLIVLVPAVRWDILLFRFRTMAGATSVENVAQAGKLLWASDIGPSGATMISKLADIGAYGYLATTAVAVLMLEMAFKKVNEYFSRFMAPADELLASWSTPQGDQTIENGTDAGQLARAAVIDAYAAEEGIGVDGGKPRFDGAQASPEATQNAEESPETPRKRPVMGGKPGDEVELQEALGHPDRFHVDNLGTVWTRSFWNELHQTPEPVR